MIEARTDGENQTPKATTPETITTSMIITDLENSIDRTGIKEKYGLENWEVAQIFKHPALKGKKVRKVRKMSFNFVDDTPQMDPAQVTVDDVILEETPLTTDQENTLQAEHWENQQRSADNSNELNY